MPTGEVLPLLSPEAQAAIIGAGAALVGALGTQWLAARSALKLRRLQLLFERKSARYSALLESLGALAFEPSLATYKTYLAEYQQTRLVASREVLDTLDRSEGLHECAIKIRESGNIVERLLLGEGPWQRAVESAVRAMQYDLKRLAGD